jgi:hypothetical protein
MWTSTATCVLTMQTVEMFSWAPLACLQPCDSREEQHGKRLPMRLFEHSQYILISIQYTGGHLDPRAAHAGTQHAPNAWLQKTMHICAGKYGNTMSSIAQALVPHPH